MRTAKLDIQHVVSAANTQATKIFGLNPREGTIRLGVNAGVMVYNPKNEGKLSAATHVMNVDRNAF